MFEIGTKRLVVSLLVSLVSAAPPGQKDKRVTINTSVVNLGLATSTLPNIYRDGGGGGDVNGLHWMWFSDGIYTKDGRVPADDLSNWANFTSNSIAASGYQGKAINQLTDFGDTTKGPRQQIPYYYNAGESDSVTGIWPNQNWVTLCDGGCALSYPIVVNRTAISAGVEADLYNTPVHIEIGAFGPIATRPVQALFRVGEPLYGSFSAFLGVDGYIYAFAKITNTQTSNGLKLARVPNGQQNDRSQYRYWNGNAWSATMPAYDDGGAANVFKYSTTFFGNGPYGPGTGEVFYSPAYGCYLLLFMGDDSAVNPNVYLSYSSSLFSGWSTPVLIYTTPTFSGGYNYAFHAYPNYDSTGRVIPISWSQYAPSATYEIGMANITFS
ncbi:hypothetical protein GQ53DRAFT_726707 [Thozetella sp. PMI_491]|nr:hypothetical protein GQ53DRAFT_726707 [Thozetella sp. PMI_491]